MQHGTGEREWLEYFGRVYGVPLVVVEPTYTCVNCSNCGGLVVKTLSTRTNQWPHCGYIADRGEFSNQHTHSLD
nr:zinc ribbon domain-containing protein [Okeania sp. SIO2C9]